MSSLDHETFTLDVHSVIFELKRVLCTVQIVQNPVVSILRFNCVSKRVFGTQLKILRFAFPDSCVLTTVSAISCVLDLFLELRFEIARFAFSVLCH